MYSYLLLSGVIAFTVLGDYALKYASMKPTPIISHWFIGGVVFYAITAVGWLYLMQSHNLAQIAILYSGITILTLTGIGYLFFDEQVSTRQAVALSAALISVFLVHSEN